jgi:hypothetical protein
MGYHRVLNTAIIKICTKIATVLYRINTISGLYIEMLIKLCFIERTIFIEYTRHHFFYVYYDQSIRIINLSTLTTQFRRAR